MSDASIETQDPQRSRWKRPLFLGLGIGGILVVAAVIAFLYAASQFFGRGAPGRPEWAQSVAEFERVVATMPAAPTGDGYLSFETPATIGSYEISRAERVPSGALFYDTVGCGILDDAGIAYLPNGIDPSLENGNFEAPQYKSLGGPWYSFCASW